MDFEELLKSGRPPKKDKITDADLARLFRKYRGLLKQWERDKAFWAATHENIRIASTTLDELVKERTAELQRTNEQLMQGQERIEHLNRALRAIRNVNQLIVKEKDRDRLLKGICDNFTKTRGCDAAWIALLDEAGGLIATSESGWGKDFLPMVRRLEQGELPDCGQRALRQSAAVTTEESSSTCTGCPLAKGGSNRGAMTIRLEHNGKVYGLLSTNIPARFLAEPEECALFEEVAEDIAFALHGMELEQARKKMEEQLIVSDRLASLGELVSGVAHELNNPLTGVIGFAQLLLDKDIPDDVKEDVKIIYREAQRTANIIKNLLTFARKQPKEKQLTDINSAIKTVLELRAYEQNVNNIRVDTQFAPDLPGIIANTFEIQQVFLNIIVNAEHFMIEAHGGGILTITTEQEGDIIRASLADDGPGISKENLGHVFNPFFTTKEVGKGTGLGLSICYGTITEHGGKIYAKSELGKGTTFIIELPVATTDNEGTTSENS